MRKVLLASALAAVYLAGCSVLPGVKQYDTLEDGPGRILQPNEDAAGQSEPFSEQGNKSPYSVNGRFYYVMEDPAHYRARGKASWYGNKFHGRKTSSGEDFDMYAMTAAHRNLPLPTYLEVTNLDNGKVAFVKVNDRGPYVDDRLVDLSYAAAVKLGMLEKGNAPVEIRAITGNGVAEARRQAEEDAAAARLQASTSNDELPTADSPSEADLLAATDLLPDADSQPAIDVASVAGAAEDVSDDTVKSAAEIANASASAVSEEVESVAQLDQRSETVAEATAAVPVPLPVSETPSATATPAAATISGRNLSLQLGAFSKVEGAVATMDKAQALLPAIPAFVLQGQSNGNAIYRVRVGPVNTRELIDEATEALINGGFSDPRVLPMDDGGDCVAGCR